ncbi:ABC transporter permease [Cellulomonas triticagri]|uniref:Transport permease protein n=1 Tax=Cellulomonas triticagri TaxID=2483352 RepID=A0A3M2JNU0_9CELL|nr:ABC transporter permease [Cellulomonas triticagri]
MTMVRELRAAPELLANLTRREVKGKYKRTVLGQLWSLVNPLAQMIIFTAVFSFVLRVPIPTGDPSGLHNFAVFLLCGLLPWGFFVNVINGGMDSLVANENLIKKVAFPRAALPLASAFSLTLSWSIEMVVLLVALTVLGAASLLWTPALVLVMALLFAFAFGVALLLSVANVYFRDTQHFVGILTQAWFYATPIVYPTSLVLEQSEKIGSLIGSWTLYDFYRLNPMERFVELFRSLLYDNRWPPLDSTLYCVAWALVALVVGAAVFRRHEKKLAEAL